MIADAVFDLLAAHGAALCISDHHHAPAPWLATAPFVYVSGNGPGGCYRDSYGEAELDRWAAHIVDWRDEGRDVFAYVDNDIGCAAPGDARRQQQTLIAFSDRRAATGSRGAGAAPPSHLRLGRRAARIGAHRSCMERMIRTWGSRPSNTVTAWAGGRMPM